MPTETFEERKKALLDYRKLIADAKARGDHAWIGTEIERNQLTEDDMHRLKQKSLDRIAAGHTPIADWPDVDPDMFAPGTFPDEPNPLLSAKKTAELRGMRSVLTQNKVDNELINRFTDEFIALIEVELERREGQ